MKSKYRNSNENVETLLEKALESPVLPDTGLLQETKYSIIQEEKMLSQPKKIKSLKIPLMVATALLLFALVGFTYGNHIIQLLGGGQIKEGVDSEGNQFVSADMGFVDEPIEVRDNQIYFLLDGSNIDITDQCSETTYFQYEKTADNGYRHVILIGGTVDQIGMAEYVWDENNIFKGGNASYGKSEKPLWLISGEAALDIE